MKIEVIRDRFDPSYTTSEMWIDGLFECFVLEDTVREIAGQPVQAWKIKGQTAIPYGTYNVVITMSNRFKRLLPLLENVPGFEGIRIHPGNTDADTEGCLLVGTSRNKNFVGESRIAFNKLLPRMQAALALKERVSLTIR